MASRQTAASKRGLLATRGRKIAAAIGAAFLATLGAGLGARALNSAESATKKVLAGNDAPIEVRVLRRGTFFGGHPYAPYYVFPKSEVSSPTELSPEDLQGDFPFGDALAEKHGAIPGSPEIIRLQLRGKLDEPVTVNDLKVDVVERGAPLEGWFVVSGGCGGLAIRTAEIDLDTPTPQVRFLDENFDQRKFTLFVTRDDIEVVELHVSTKTSMVDWTVQLFYSGPDGDGSVVVDDAGKPFRVTAETRSEGYSLLINPTKLVREPSWDAGIHMC